MLRNLNAMHSSLFQHSDEEDSEVWPEQMEDICAAADLLLEVFSQMQLLAPTHEELACALTRLGPKAHHRLRALQETIEQLVRTEPDKRKPLRERATALIKYLFDELETYAPVDDSCESNPATLH